MERLLDRAGLGGTQEAQRLGGLRLDMVVGAGGVGLAGSGVPPADLLADALLLAVSVGELLCVFERAAELLACGGGLA